jgi:hypothetical protein
LYFSFFAILALVSAAGAGLNRRADPWTCFSEITKPVMKSKFGIQHFGVRVASASISMERSTLLLEESRRHWDLVSTFCHFCKDADMATVRKVGAKGKSAGKDAEGTKGAAMSQRRKAKG